MDPTAAQMHSRPGLWVRQRREREKEGEEITVKERKSIQLHRYNTLLLYYTHIWHIVFCKKQIITKILQSQTLCL